MLEPEIFDFIPEGRPVDFSEEVFPAVLEAEKPLFGYVAGGYWEDVGTLDAYLQAHQDILDENVAVQVAGFPLRPGVWLGKGAELDPTAEVRGPAIIGDNCHIGADGVLGRYCVIGANARIGDNASLERTVVHDNAFLGRRGPPRRLRAGPVLRPAPGGALRGGGGPRRRVFVGAHAVIKSGVKVYPFKTVEAGATVNSSIVWESRGSRIAVRPPGHHRARQRRHQPRAGHAPVDGVGQHPREGQHHHGVA